MFSPTHAVFFSKLDNMTTAKHVTVMIGDTQLSIFGSPMEPMLVDEEAKSTLSTPETHDISTRWICFFGNLL